ncbi:venom serine protease 34-like [Bradysia coprophila]|uniref:venom serine protease 34-like n=1 Tax=Bradysia coprophila TaxID=38358 RepID=UPI00187DC254|nr:venom serine protease 34-like [Bradysia coprophila]
MKLRTLFIVLCVPLLLMLQSSAQDCGRRRTSRIVGGVNTGVNEFTMMAGIVADNSAVYCGGTILANYYVLTAAHCVAGRNPASLKVLVGDWDYSIGADTSFAAVYLVQRCNIYPGYNPNTNTNDIAIITTQRSIVYNVAVGPVCLPPTNLLFTGSTVEAVGWGSTEFGGPKSTVLKKVQIGVISNDDCRRTYSYISNSHLCTYGSNGRDSCQFDSGGPVYYMLNGRVNLVGIIIGGIGCAGNYPSINTRVTTFVSWIRQNTPGAVYY